MVEMVSGKRGVEQSLAPTSTRVGNQKRSPILSFGLGSQQFRLVGGDEGVDDLVDVAV